MLRRVQGDHDDDHDGHYDDNDDANDDYDDHDHQVIRSRPHDLPCAR